MFSIVIPLYNKAETVLDSVLSATKVEGLERIVVVDDGSTDDSLKRLSEVCDERLIVVTQANAGPGAARNRGLMECDSDYVLFLDADDEVYPDIFTSAHSAFSQHSECAAVIHAWHVGNERVFEGERYQIADISSGLFSLPPSIDAIRFKRIVDMCHSGSTVIKSECVRSCGGFFDSWKCTYAEDSYFWIRVLLSQQVFFSLQPLMWFNTEASELGVGRVGRKPSRPIVVDSRPTREFAPRRLRRALKRLVKLYVNQELSEAISLQDGTTVKCLIRKYPEVLFDNPRIAARIVKNLPSLFKMPKQ